MKGKDDIDAFLEKLKEMERDLVEKAKELEKMRYIDMKKYLTPITF